MKSFLDKDFMLESEAAKKLYHEYAAHLPIIDYHCHINPQDIAEDKKYESITEVWLGGDHYKWRLIRANGVPESEITGSLKNDPYKVFAHFADTLPKAVGNPVYHWAYLELKRYFGVEKQLNAATAKEIYDHCNEILKKPERSVRGLIDESRVKLLCTTDDPIDDLRWHKVIREDATCKVKVLPAFRPDKAMNIDKEGFVDYIKSLGDCVGHTIGDFAGLCSALDERIDFFQSMGCRASDHALEYVVCAEATPGELDFILSKALEGGQVTALEAEQFRTALLLSVAKKYKEYGWVMQIHFGCIRNLNTAQFGRLGPDTGFDAINADSRPERLALLLDRMNSESALPRMVLYSLNHADNEIINTIAGCFMADADCPGQIQLGAAWWFNDTNTGMVKQMTDLANGGLLGNFIGMLTDSRSFLSYTRHEYFRRILCNLIGGWVESGQYGADDATLKQIIQDICYNNTVRYFGLDLPLES